MPSYGRSSEWIERIPPGDPLDVVRELAAAIEVGDARKAEDLSTVAGWLAPRGGIGRLFRVAARSGCRVAAVGPAQTLDRHAAVRFHLVPAGGGVAKPHLMLLHTAGGMWSVEGVTRSSLHAAAFLQGALPALLTWSALPSCPRARAWGETMLGNALRVGTVDPPQFNSKPEASLLAALSWSSAQGLKRPEIIRAVALWPERISAVTLAMADPSRGRLERTAYLVRTHSGPWSVVAVTVTPSIETLVGCLAMLSDPTQGSSDTPVAAQSDH